MNTHVILAIDAMGGDHGPEVILAGLDCVRVRKPFVRFLLFGHVDQLNSILSRYPELQKRCDIIHTDVVVDMNMKPSAALRKGRNVSSMWLAIEAVKQGKAQAAISAGNTGALMAMSKFCLRMMADVARPAIAALWPSLKGESIVLDVGATVGADADQLIDFAIMGAAMSRALTGKKKPSVGLLNVGVEEIKGLEPIKEAGARLKELKLDFLDYQGFVEGDDIGRGRVDIVVTEGFSGNIALKTAEGTARQIASYLKSAMSRTLMAKIGYLFAKHAFEALKDKMNPSKVNGGVFLGLNGLVIKSHGSADAEGIASAVELAANMVENHLFEKISKDISTARDMLEFSV